ncbi:MAG: hypothetical protein ACK5N0_03935 [Synechococcaceae cyanobacterium]
MTSLRASTPSILVLIQQIFSIDRSRGSAPPTWLLPVLVSFTIPAGNALAANVNYGVPTPPGPFVSPMPGMGLPAPVNVPGKEFTTNINTNFAGANVPGQSLIWDGLGGTANIYNYGVEVDALANVGDALFMAVIDNKTYLLLSMQGDNHQQSIFAINPLGSIQLWATNQTIKTSPPAGNPPAPFDLNGLEVWGPDAMWDANRFSPAFDRLPGDISASVVDATTNLVIYDRLKIATAIGRPDLEADIDLDALIQNGNSIIFSIQPIDSFDGGEIWVWDGSSSSSAQYLQFGGKTWNTALDLQNYFGSYGYDIGTENIDALEAASVPGPLPLMGAGAAFGFTRKLRRRVKAFRMA